MKKRCYIALFLCFFSGAGTGALDFDSDAYGDIAAYLDAIYGADDNAGLTAFPLLNIPIGGRAEALASSFGAVADDASFLECNPAASSRLDRSELAFFHNNWIADTKIEGLVFTYRIGNLGLAAGARWLYTPFSEYDILGNRVSKGYYSEAETILNGSYNFFPDYNFSGLSLGLNLKGAFRFVPDFADSESGKPSSGSGWEQSAAMMMADIGLLTRFDLLKFYRARREKNSSLSLVIRNIGPPVRGEGLPTTITAALAYKPIRTLLFSFDFFLPLNLENIKLSEKPYWALGLAVDLTGFLTMQGGIRMKNGSCRLVLGSTLNITGWNRETGNTGSSGNLALDINYSVDMLTRIQMLSRLSMAIRVDLGDQGRAAKADKVDALYLEGLDAYALNRYEEARECWKQALELDSRYLPAALGLAVVEEALALQRRMETLQQLDF
ncbi:MAG: UPF0164 family protein [Treponema sp.]|jgi:tetratricopeptide (TPR) repeat protein|nr:UPF0164 family protein [Treponema sp.]